MIPRKVWRDEQFVGLPAIARRMNLNRETILKMHYNASSPKLSFPMYRSQFKNTLAWVTSNFLIYEWELRMAKFNYEQLRRELGLPERGRVAAFEKLISRWHRKKSIKDYKDDRIARIVAKIVHEKPIFAGDEKKFSIDRPGPVYG